MPSIDLQKVGISVGVGVVDEVVERMDSAAGRSGLTSWSNMLRLALVVGGHAATMMGRGNIAGMGETAAIAATPLLVKSLAGEFVKGKMLSAFTFSPRRVGSGASARDWAPSTPGRSAYRPIQ